MSARLKLSGQRNQCPACREYFNSNFAFDKHRVGAFGPDRRCSTVEEMTGRGYVRNTAGFWVTSAYVRTEAENAA